MKKLFAIIFEEFHAISQKMELIYLQNMKNVYRKIIFLPKESLLPKMTIKKLQVKLLS